MMLLSPVMLRLCWFECVITITYVNGCFIETINYYVSFLVYRSHPRKVRRKRRHSKRRHDSSTVETTTDDESSGGEGSEGRRPRRKSRKGRVTPTSDKNLNSSSYSYKQNNYGLHDPFSEWAPKVTKYRDPTLPIVHNYPKSPSVPRRQLDTTVNLAT